MPMIEVTRNPRRKARMSPIAATGLTPRELTALRTALAPGRAAAAAPELGRARIAAQLLWRERMGSLAHTPAR